MTYPPQQPQQWPQQQFQQQYHPPQPYQPYPQRAVSRQRLNPGETAFHLIATIMTGGLWGFVWWARVRSRTTVTRYR